MPLRRIHLYDACQALAQIALRHGFEQIGCKPQLLQVRRLANTPGVREQNQPRRLEPFVAHNPAAELKSVASRHHMVEHGQITEDNFRDFTFTNPVTLHGGMNPKFFEGTVVEKQAAAVLGKG